MAPTGIPPFTLADDQTYPAGLQVDYPERLSRGLVLIKWWLLALPHYLLLMFFLGAGARAARQTDDLQWMWEGGLIALLVLFVGIALLFTGSYLHGLYRLLLGLNRWVMRVIAYVALMTDVYPPFRLDQGGPDPGGSGARPRAPWPPLRPPPSPPRCTPPVLGRTRRPRDRRLPEPRPRDRRLPDRRHRALQPHPRGPPDGSSVWSPAPSSCS